MIAYVAAPASGAHFNPIVTFAFMATGILVRLPALYVYYVCSALLCHREAWGYHELLSPSSVVISAFPSSLLLSCASSWLLMPEPKPRLTPSKYIKSPIYVLHNAV